MKRRRIFIITPLSVALTAGMAHLLASPTQAQEISIGIFPTITEITTYSGETVEAQITVKNFEASPVALTTLLQPFTASSEENGQVRYLEEIPEVFGSIRVLDQNEPVNEISLSANQEKTLTVSLSIPESEASHDYYYSLVFLSKPATVEEELPQEGIHADSSLSAGVAAHFIVSVNPKATRDLSVAEFSSETFSQQSPVDFTIRVANQGPNFAKVGGEIKVTNIFGITADKVLIPPTTVLSQSTRSLTSKTSSHNLQAPKVAQTTHLFPGIYRAHLTLKKNDGSAPLSNTIYFAVAPVELLLALLVVLVVGVLIRYRLKRKYFS